MRHGLGGLLPEGDEGVLVQDQRVREHVAPGEKGQINSHFKKLITFFTIPISLTHKPGGCQQVHLLQAVELVLVEPHLALLHVALNLVLNVRC